MRKKSSDNNIIKGMFILMTAITIVKILGALFKIPLSRILTPVGCAYFYSAYALYAPLYSLCAAGFSVAVSHLVSRSMAEGRLNDVRIIRKKSIKLFMIIGLIGMTIMLLAAVPFAIINYPSNPKGLIASVWVLAPSVFFCAIASAYKGYNEGMKNMVPTGISQILEALCKLIFGLTFAYLILYYADKEYINTGCVFGVIQQSQKAARLAAYPAAAAGAVFGVTLGSMVSVLYLIIRLKIKGDGIKNNNVDLSQQKNSEKEILKRIWQVSAPIALSAFVMNLSALADSTCINYFLKKTLETLPNHIFEIYNGMIPQETIQNGGTASFLYGCFTNAWTIYLFIPTITQAVGSSALPQVTEAFSSKSHNKITHQIKVTITISCMIAFPAGLGLFIFADPISSLLFGSQNAPKITADILRILGPAAALSAVSTPINSIIQSSGNFKIPLKLLSITLGIKTILNCVLISIPSINVRGAAISTFISGFILIIMQIRVLKKIVSKPINVFPSVLVAALMSFITCTAALMLYNSLPQSFLPSLKLAFSIALVPFLYFCVLIIIKLLKNKEYAKKCHQKT